MVPEAIRNSDKSQNIYLYLIKKNEKDVIRLVLNLQSKLTSEEIQSLMEEAKSSPMCKLKILLYQLQGDFDRCLSLFF